MDSLVNKSKYLCEYAKFISLKQPRKRSWSKKSSINNVNVTDIVHDLIDLVNSDFDCSQIRIVKHKLFPLKRHFLIEIKDLYIFR